MANEFNYISKVPAIITVFIYNEVGDKLSYSISCTDKSSTGTLIYTGNFPDNIAPGRYSIRYFSGSTNDLNNVVKEEYILWDGDNAITGLTTLEKLMIKELHQIEGLDSTNPLTVTKTTREVGNIKQIYEGDRQNFTIATRK